MSNDRDPLVDGDVLETLLSGDPAAVARLGWHDPERVRAVLGRLAQVSSAPTDSPLAALASQVVPYGRSVLADALVCLGIEGGLRMLDQASLPDLVGRWALVPYLLTEPSFLTIAELADVLEEFADHLDANRASLIRMGVPQTTLGASHPGTLLSYLYPTRSIMQESQTIDVDPASASPRDRALKHLPAWQRATRRHSYWWLRKELSTRGDELVQEDAYEEAARIPDLTEEAATRLEAGREGFLDLQITVLRTLAKALHDRDEVNLWPRCLNLLTEQLPADAAAFYLQMDQWFYGYDITRGTEDGNGYLSVYPGGLSNLLLLIGHCEKELRIGTMHRSKDRMPPAILDDPPFRTYFQAIGQPWQPEFDRALDHCGELMGQESAYWAAYLDRINHAIPGELLTQVIISIAVRRKFAAALERQLRAVAEVSCTTLEYMAALPTLEPSIQLSAPSDSGIEAQNVFRKDGDTWTIRYAGKAVQIPASLRGFDYLVYLLRHPDQVFEVQELDKLIRANLGPAPDAGTRSDLNIDDRDDGFRIGGIGDAGDLTSKETIKNLRQRLRELEVERKSALASGNKCGADRVRSEQAAIKNYLAATVDRFGRPRKAADPAERARTNVQRRIKSAIERITDKHPVLAAHLMSSVKTGDYCSYAPPLAEKVNWTF